MLAPQEYAQTSVTKESKVQALIKELLEKIPSNFDFEDIAYKNSPQEETNPLKIVLM